MEDYARLSDTHQIWPKYSCHLWFDQGHCLFGVYWCLFFLYLNAIRASICKTKKTKQKKLSKINFNILLPNRANLGATFWQTNPLKAQYREGGEKGANEARDGWHHLIFFFYPRNIVTDHELSTCPVRQGASSQVPTLASSIQEIFIQVTDYSCRWRGGRILSAVHRINVLVTHFRQNASTLI